MNTILHDRKCNVLGRYCWTHRAAVESGIPGWGKKPHSDNFVRRSPWTQDTEQIIWANGDTEDPKRGYQCGMCHKEPCIIGAPVPPSTEYKEVLGKSADEYLKEETNV